jgi:hypothetical protein
MEGGGAKRKEVKSRSTVRRVGIETEEEREDGEGVDRGWRGWRRGWRRAERRDAATAAAASCE